jgi:hypothetical protein
MVDAVSGDLAAKRPVALGFECPLYVPVPEQPLRLGTARIGEGNRSWSAGAGAGAMATGAVQVAWILDQLRRRAPNAKPFLDWNPFTHAGHALFLWEAFVTDRAKAATHVDDAIIAATAFRNAFPDVTGANAVTADRPLSLLGAALLWSGGARLGEHFAGGTGQEPSQRPAAATVQSRGSSPRNSSTASSARCFAPPSDSNSPRASISSAPDLALYRATRERRDTTVARLTVARKIGKRAFHALRELELHNLTGQDWP